MEKYYSVNSEQEKYDINELLELLYDDKYIYENELDSCIDSFNENNDGARINGEYWEASQIYSAMKGDECLYEALYEIAGDICQGRRDDAKWAIERLVEGEETTLYDTIMGMVKVRLAEPEEEIEEDNADFDELLVA